MKKALVTDVDALKAKLEHYLQIDKIVYRITVDLINVSSENIDDKLNYMLREVGEYFGMDRAYIFLISDNDLIDNTHEWCREGIVETMQHLKGIPVSGFTWWLDETERFGNVHIPRVIECEDEATRQMLLPFGVQSLLSVPLLKGDEYIGLIGFDSVMEEKTWDGNEINMLEMMAYVVSGAISTVRREQELIDARSKAVEGDQIKSAFLSSISHELRTPLHHVIGFSELITQLAENEEIASFADMISESGKQLLTMVEDLFNLSIFNEGNIRPQREEFKLADLFNDLKHGFDSVLNIASKNDVIENIFECDKELLDRMIVSDKRKISSILYHIYRNAVKFTERGIIRFHVITSDNKLLFAIRDSGIGIDSKIQKDIFGLFMKAKTVSSNLAGIGIGLPIAQLLTKAINGQLYLDSEPGKGSSFYLEIDFILPESGS
jgi:signal transduction histidine kinase